MIKPAYPFDSECFGPIFKSHLERIKEIIQDPTIPDHEVLNLIMEEAKKAALLTAEKCEIKKINDDIDKLCDQDACTETWVVIRLISNGFRVYNLVTEMAYHYARTKATHEEAVKDLKIVSDDFAQLVRIMIGKH
mmetsp:Transcript_10796/g.12141  ORF Transcript_10796/g.12141 Transcript_10796/m.12141 type:complete len:135 (-) Transcript_10796:3-407(-)|eukprot:CAMPEP_0168337396 /NCGR_PEP_ID=MMETSP0213-20121227/12154_1 /TAXON_ID=151035 /ORGANISM="Euplotes harpa, Strain FSP1.4" /LENGTH=134 /DNA_ID=CAMNT_0008342855 /DNA_START=189 /DNA_END=593 /DNA_ORIENTATION=-